MTICMLCRRSQGCGCCDQRFFFAFLDFLAFFAFGFVVLRLTTTSPDTGSVTQVLEAMQGAAAQASAVFVPEGLYLARLLIAISLVWFCVDWYHGRETAVAGGLALAARGAGTLWAIQNWARLTGVAVSGAHAAIGRPRRRAPPF